MINNYCLALYPQPTNETVEKLVLESRFPGQPLVERPDSRSEGGLTDVSLRHESVERHERVDPADIVDQSKPRTRPLHIHFGSGKLSLCQKQKVVRILALPDHFSFLRLFSSSSRSPLDTAVNRWAALRTKANLCIAETWHEPILISFEHLLDQLLFQMCDTALSHDYATS